MKSILARHSDRALSASILLCDSSHANREQLGGLLLAENLQVLEADNGEQALELFFNNLPDLVVVADNITGTNGYKICGQIRNSHLAEPELPVPTIKQVLCSIL